MKKKTKNKKKKKQNKKQQKKNNKKTTTTKKQKQKQNKQKNNNKKQKTKKKNITKTCLYNVDPLKPHFSKVKLGFTGVYIIFLISAQNIDCGYSLEPPRQGGSNEYPQSMF